MVRPGENIQPRGGYEGGLYRGRGGQITWRAGGQYTGVGNRRGSLFNRGGNQSGPWRDPNAMDVNRGTGGDRRCYHCGNFGHMAWNCWDKNKARVVEMPQESAKKNGG